MWFVLCVLMEMCIGKHCVVPLTRMQKPLDDVPSWSGRRRAASPNVGQPVVYGLGPSDWLLENLGGGLHG